jgi:hypothetical protein
VISGDALRAARRDAGLSQADLANELDVSARTIRNWEVHGGVVPEKYGSRIAAVLPDLIPSADGNLTAADEEDTLWLAQEIEKSTQRALRRAEASGDTRRAAELHGKIAGQATMAFEFAKTAAELGADPEMVRAMGTLTLNILLDTGTMMLLARSGDGDSFTRTVMQLAAEVERAADSYTYEGDEHGFRVGSIALSGSVEKRGANASPPSDVGGESDDVELPIAPSAEVADRWKKSELARAAKRGRKITEQ